ncbi:hypothetical protein J5X84_16965 [Streptosporangiaceae bacterium NEAU-GS5]|nr:hypothetical protein [Streptosporangiaceae bacterium NEAU-GS5]
MRRSMLLTLGTAGALLVGAPALASLTWTAVPAPNPSAAHDQFAAVSARTTADAWAVGDFLGADADDDGLQMLAARWDGARWQQVRTPAVLHQDESLLAVSASSATEAWAVGFTKGVGAAGRNTLAVRWNGTAWSIVPTPATSGGSKAQLNAVVSLGPADAWAVGRSRAGRALAEHWDGAAWSIVQLPAPVIPAGTTLQSSTLTGISAASPTDIWAVGNISVLSGTTARGRTLAMHYDGRTWRVTPTRDATVPDTLNAVTAVASNDVWAVGNTFKTDGTNFPDRPLIEHWDGAVWSIVASPAVPVENTLSGVAARSGTDVWAVGNFVDRGRTVPVARTLALHWDGVTWSPVGTVNGASGDTALKGVAATPGGGDMWAVGFSLTATSTFVLRNTP